MVPKPSCSMWRIHVLPNYRAPRGTEPPISVWRPASTKPQSGRSASTAARRCYVGAKGARPPTARDFGALLCRATMSVSKATTGPRFTAMPAWLRRELRSDHAGEYGAVMIYRGILAVSNDARVRQFAERHLVTEGQHLSVMEQIVPYSGRTKLLPVWRVMGWVTGALPALLGPQAVFATIEAVERFVDHHYQQQIDQLETHGEYGSLRQTLLDCQADEVSHRNEATHLALPQRGLLLRLWCTVVGLGSAAAVVAARRV